MNDILGYVRVSTGDIKVFTNLISGKSMVRAVLDELIARARQGDTLRG